MRYEIFLDTQFVKADDDLLKSLTPGFMKGKGVFETLKFDAGKIIFLEKHAARLKKGLKIIQADHSFSKSRIERISKEVLKKNDLKLARLRWAVWRDRNKIHLSVAGLPYKPPSSDQYQKGFKACIVPVRSKRKPGFTFVKSTDYKDFLKALEWAKKKGFDEAILCNRLGELVEGSRTNLFFVKDNVLCTPAFSCGCLSGITRQVTIKIARRLKIPVKEGRFRPEDLKYATEAFLTNALIDIMPMTSCNGRTIGHGQTGPMTKRLGREMKRLT